MNLVETHRRLARGEINGFDRLLWAGLWPLSLLYGAGAGLRNLAYDLGLLKSCRVAPFVISVGSLAAGGAGKTPLTACLANRLFQENISPLIAATGYGAITRRNETRLLSASSLKTGDEDWTTAGDEAILLRQMAPNIPLVVGRKRETAAAIALGHNLNPKVIILDSGFQYRRLHRDFNIVLLDVSSPPEVSHLLPLGDRRESWGSLKRADFIVLHRAELCSDTTVWEKFLTRQAPGTEYCWCRNHLISWRLLAAREDDRGRLRASPLSELTGIRTGVWTALGNPESFVKGLIKEGINPVTAFFAPDHASFTPETVKQLITVKNEHQLDRILVTEKDGVKMEGWHKELQFVVIIKAELELPETEKILWPALLHRIAGH